MIPAQIQASRTNGARSRGPTTRLGKQKSARNSFRRGLLAQTVVLEGESTDRFLDLLADYMDEFQPSTAAQVSLVETMAVARWRQLRVWGAQKTAMDRDMALQDPSVGPAPVRVLLALRGSPECPCPPDVLLRYEIAFDRQFSRALTRLLALQSRTGAEPLQPYHPETPAGQTWKEENISTAKRTPEVIEDTEPASPQGDSGTPQPAAPLNTPREIQGEIKQPEPKTVKKQSVEGRPTTSDSPDILLT